MTGLAKIDGLLAFTKSLGGRWSLQIDYRNPKSADKILWLADGGRSFLALSAPLRYAIYQALSRAFKGSIDSLMGDRSQAVMDAAAQAAKAHILRRFEAGGFDVRMTPLTAKYAAFKRMHGFDPRLGIKTGDLIDDIRNATFSFKRT